MLPASHYSGEAGSWPSDRKRSVLFWVFWDRTTQNTQNEVLFWTFWDRTTQNTQNTQDEVRSTSGLE